MRVRWLRMVMAFDRVGHRLPYAMSRGYAAQKTTTVVGHSWADEPDQFRVDCAAIEKVCYSTEIINKIDELFVP